MAAWPTLTPEITLLGGGESLAEGVLMLAKVSISRSTHRCSPHKCWWSRAPLALGVTWRTKMGWKLVPGMALALLPAWRGRCYKNILCFPEGLRNLILMQLMLTWDCFGEIQPFEPPTQTSLNSQQVIKKPNEFKEDNTKSNVTS